MRQVRELSNCHHSWHGGDAFEEDGEAISPSTSQAQAEHGCAAGRTEDRSDHQGGAADGSQVWCFVVEDEPFEQLHEVEQQADQAEDRFRPEERLQAETVDRVVLLELLDPLLAVSAGVVRAPALFWRTTRRGDDRVVAGVRVVEQAPATSLGSPAL